MRRLVDVPATESGPRPLSSVAHRPRASAAPPSPTRELADRLTPARVRLSHVFVALALLLSLGAATVQVSEHAAKAAMLLKFLSYVKWPERAFESPGAPLRIAVVGADPFGRVLDETFKDKKLGSHAIEIVRFKSIAEIEHCHVLFAPQSESARVEQILAQVRGKPVLVVGESKGFAAAGGCINFQLADKKIGFEINPEAAKRAELELSSQLLKLAKIVKDEKSAEEESR